MHVRGSGDGGSAELRTAFSSQLLASQFRHSLLRLEGLEEETPGARKLYSLVLLDTAATIEDPALEDFDFFLQNLTVE